MAPEFFLVWQALVNGDDGGAAAHALPTVYRVWLHRSDTPDRTGRAVYFQAGGEDYAVFASLSPKLVARRLPAGWLREKLLPAQKQATGYAQTIIPCLEGALPESWVRPADEEGSVAISAQAFEDLFAGSDVELEAIPFAAAFARELQDLAGAAAHARRSGHRLHLRQV